MTGSGCESQLSTMKWSLVVGKKVSFFCLGGAARQRSCWYILVDLGNVRWKTSELLWCQTLFFCTEGFPNNSSCFHPMSQRACRIITHAHCPFSLTPESREEINEQFHILNFSRKRPNSIPQNKTIVFLRYVFNSSKQCLAILLFLDSS